MTKEAKQENHIDLSLYQEELNMCILGLDKLKLFCQYKALQSPPGRLNEFDYMVDMIEELRNKLCAISYLGRQQFDLKEDEIDGLHIRRI